MSSDKLKEIINGLNEKGEMRFADPVTEEQIEKFERETKVLLPEQYKEWLLLSDGGELFLPAGIQLYGVGHKPIIDVSDENRPSDDYIVIGSFCFGDSIICNKNGNKIIVYNHELGVVDDDLTYSDFISFITDLPELLGVEAE